MRNTFVLILLPQFSCFISNSFDNDGKSSLTLIYVHWLYSRISCFTTNTKPSAVTIQIGRPTWLRDLTSFGSEITRLTGELLADTTQMAPYIQITWEPHLKTLTSSETYPQKYRPVDRTNMSTFEEMSVWIALRQHGIRKEFSLFI